MTDLEKLREVINWLSSNPTHYMQLHDLNNKIIKMAKQGQEALNNLERL